MRRVVMRKGYGPARHSPILQEVSLKGVRGCTGTIPTATGYRLCRLPKRHTGDHE